MIGSWFHYETDMFVFEIWESPEALERHIHAEHYLEFSRLRKPMLTSYKYFNYEAEKIAEGDSIPTWR